MSEEFDLDLPQVTLEVGVSNTVEDTLVDTLVAKWADRIYFIRGQMLSRAECLKMASEIISEAKQEVQEDKKNA